VKRASMLLFAAGCLGSALFLTARSRSLPRQSASAAAVTAPNVGEVNFSTSCTAAAQPLLETGVALLHSFQYQQADQSFSEVAKLDTKCGMAHWGKAMTHYEQLWEFPPTRALNAGAKEIREAQKLSAGTERERQYIQATAIFYLPDAKREEKDRVQAFSTALANIQKQWPDDANAAAFYALSLVALAEQQEVDPTANRKAAIEILEPLCRKVPNNPGPAHYLIHATDTPEFAAQGLEAARAYAKIAPDSSHALHMPSHIFVRLGLWHESIASNLAAAESAAKATSEHRAPSHYQFHALDFLNYSYLQSGQESKAREVVKSLENVPGADRQSIAEHQAWLSARNALELHRWKEAAELPIPNVPRDSQESIYRVRAIGAARAGDAAHARSSLASYVEISAGEKGSSHHKGEKPEKSVRQLEAEAWISLAEGKSAEALEALRSAAQREDAEGVDSLAIPAREMLADMLLELKRPSDALSEYQAALKNSPMRFNSVYGALRAAREMGDASSAEKFQSTLMAICGPGADRPEIAQAKSSQPPAAK